MLLPGGVTTGVCVWSLLAVAFDIPVAVSPPALGSIVEGVTGAHLLPQCPKPARPRDQELPGHYQFTVIGKYELNIVILCRTAGRNGSIINDFFLIRNLEEPEEAEKLKISDVFEAKLDMSRWSDVFSHLPPWLKEHPAWGNGP